MSNFTLQLVYLFHSIRYRMFFPSHGAMFTLFNEISASANPPTFHSSAAVPSQPAASTDKLQSGTSADWKQSLWPFSPPLTHTTNLFWPFARFVLARRIRSHRFIWRNCHHTTRCPQSGSSLTISATGYMMVWPEKWCSLGVEQDTYIQQQLFNTTRWWQQLEKKS